MPFVIEAILVESKLPTKPKKPTGGAFSIKSPKIAKQKKPTTVKTPKPKPIATSKPKSTAPKKTKVMPSSAPKPEAKSAATLTYTPPASKKRTSTKYTPGKNPPARVTMPGENKSGTSIPAPKLDPGMHSTKNWRTPAEAKAYKESQKAKSIPTKTATPTKPTTSTKPKPSVVKPKSNVATVQAKRHGIFHRLGSKLSSVTRNLWGKLRHKSTKQIANHLKNNMTKNKISKHDLHAAVKAAEKSSTSELKEKHRSTLNKALHVAAGAAVVGAQFTGVGGLVNTALHETGEHIGTDPVNLLTEHMTHNDEKQQKAITDYENKIEEQDKKLEELQEHPQKNALEIKKVQDVKKTMEEKLAKMKQAYDKSKTQHPADKVAAALKHHVGGVGSHKAAAATHKIPRHHP